MATQRWPTAWLLTDERMGDSLVAAIGRAARAGAGIIVRHHLSSRETRLDVARQVLKAGALLGISLDTPLAVEVGAALVHNPECGSKDLPFSLSVHNESAARAAAQSAASLVFVSPVFPTRSHPGAPALGVAGARELARLGRHPAIALGGVDKERGRALMNSGFYGWAGIDCWLRT